VRALLIGLTSAVFGPTPSATILGPTVEGIGPAGTRGRDRTGRKRRTMDGCSCPRPSYALSVDVVWIHADRMQCKANTAFHGSGADSLHGSCPFPSSPPAWAFMDKEWISRGTTPAARRAPRSQMRRRGWSSWAVADCGGLPAGIDRFLLVQDEGVVWCQRGSKKNEPR
jgi:hypothetical protein